jgi:NAD(P)-dependent dehydrogenase (short-subunit alcohol dehydrogenase family)
VTSAGLGGSVVVVTGAAQGVGEKTARVLTDRGATVVLADFNVALVEGVAAQLPSDSGAVAVSVDISKPASVRAMVDTVIERFGRVDALVNNAGIDAPPGFAGDIDEQHWNDIISVNLSGAWWCIQAVLPHMLRARRGRIVNISSLAARSGSQRYSPAYAASKAGLLGLTVGLAAQLESYGILVNAITPGATGDTGTPMLDDERAELEASFPLGTGGAQPIADAVAYLLERSGDWVSGSVLNVSGGQLRGI